MGPFGERERETWVICLGNSPAPLVMVLHLGLGRRCEMSDVMGTGLTRESCRGRMDVGIIDLRESCSSLESLHARGKISRREKKKAHENITGTGSAFGLSHHPSRLDPSYHDRPARGSVAQSFDPTILHPWEGQHLELSKEGRPPFSLSLSLGRVM